ncbi:hypothetical protein [Rhodopseudomonas palustris]|uniref:hypothetical protein n=1 Tax=Rhodopseudomonas palustris TaxID=1076 RepID=UPI001F4584DC|nr:hypothetical protein [Rhodopseudomonas palustris]
MIIAWLVLAVAIGWGAWFVARASRRALWLRVAIASLLLVAFAASFWMYGDHLDKTLGAVIGYFLLWGSVFVLSSACAGVVVGTLIALLLG